MLSRSAYVEPAGNPNPPAQRAYSPSCSAPAAWQGVSLSLVIGLLASEMILSGYGWQWGERCEGTGRRGADAEGAGDPGPGRGRGGGPDVRAGRGRDKPAGCPAGGPGERLADVPLLRGQGFPGP